MQPSTAPTEPTQERLYDFYFQEGVNSLSWCPKGTHLLALTKSGMCSLHSVEGETCQVWQAPSETTESSWKRDGSALVTWSKDGPCVLWQSIDGSASRHLDLSEGIDQAKWSPWTDLLITTGKNKIKLWSGSGRLVDVLQDHESPVTELVWHPTERNVFATSTSDGVRIWKVGENKPTHRILSKDSPSFIRFNRQGTILAYGSQDGAVNIWTIGTGVLFRLAARTTGSPLSGLDWSWGGQWLAFCRDSEACLWCFDGKTSIKPPTAPLKGCVGRISHLAFHQYEPLLACASEDGSVRVWRTDNGDCTIPIAMNRGQTAIKDLVWNPFRKTTAIAYHDGTVRLWSNRFRNKLALSVFHNEH